MEWMLTKIWLKSYHYFSKPFSPAARKYSHIQKLQENISSFTKWIAAKFPWWHLALTTSEQSHGTEYYKPLSPVAKMLLVYFTYFIFVVPAMPVPCPSSPEATYITQPPADKKKMEFGSLSTNSDHLCLGRDWWWSLAQSLWLALIHSFLCLAIRMLWWSCVCLAGKH